MATIAVFVDGGHFFDGLHAQGFSTDLHYRRLMARLANTPESDIKDISYYMARLPEGPYPNKARAQLALCERLSAEGIRVALGSTEVRSGMFIERGVEAALATDLVAAAWRHQFDAALLVSRRAAFAPAVESVKAAGHSVQTAFFHYNIDPVDGLAAVASSSRRINSADIIACTRSGPIPRGVHAAVPA
jgi:uncharacterized LabA/DUF88 family protein